MGSEDALLSRLEHLEGSKIPTYYSPGARVRAEKLSGIAENSISFIREFFESNVQNRLLVLN